MVKAPDEIVVGNWRDEKFLEGRVFDTVLMDYLVGAIDGFAPYYQVRLLVNIYICIHSKYVFPPVCVHT